MAGTQESGESHSLRGPIDRAALVGIRDVINTEEPLATAELGDYLDPRKLEVTYDEGLRDAKHARMDVQWTTRDEYSFHYTDSRGIDLRWDRHPHAGDYVHVSGLAHYHPPPDASSHPPDVKDSCITQIPALLVTRAVLKLWRAAYHAGSWSTLNDGSSSR